MTRSGNSFRWDSEVRAYELDVQGIVNNANYFCYFDHARTELLHACGINWDEWHSKGLNIVLTESNMRLKSSLRARDKFYVTSTIERISKLKILFDQKIFRTPHDELVAESENTVVCVSTKTSRPVFPDELEKLLFNNQ